MPPPPWKNKPWRSSWKSPRGRHRKGFPFRHHHRWGLRGRLNRAFTFIAIIAVLLTSFGTLQAVNKMRYCLNNPQDFSSRCAAYHAETTENTEFFTLKLLGSTIGRSSLFAALIAGGLASVMAMIITRRITAPLSRLSQAANRLAQGERGLILPLPRTSDEIGELTLAFNQLGSNLERQESWRRNLVADVAHDLRTPLAVMRAELEAMQDGITPTDQAGLARLHGEVLLLARLVSDLQTLSQAEGGGLSLELLPLELNTFLQRIFQSYQPKAQAVNRTLELSLFAVPLHIQADSDRLAQVIYNLLENALNYAPDGPLELGVKQNATHILLWVRDHGAGLKQDQLEQIFERFHRSDSSRTRAAGRGNSGLGLAIARALLEAQGGRIWAENHPQGGAIFWLEFPAIDI
jgi:two-component system, OmpR family, sensor histidine kinase BaeS